MGMVLVPWAEPILPLHIGVGVAVLAFCDGTATSSRLRPLASVLVAEAGMADSSFDMIASCV